MIEKTAKDSHYARLRRLHRDKNIARGNSNSAGSANRRSAPPSKGEIPPEGRLWIYGFHTVEAALDNPRRILHHLYLTKNVYNRLKNDRGYVDSAGAETASNKSDAEYLAEALRLSIPLSIVEPKELDTLLGSEAVHQGIVLETEPLKPRKREDFSDSSLILLLDQVTDPHNVGAIMRSAVAFGADFLITTARHSPQETGVLAKSASGALEKIDHITVRNLAEILEKLQIAGFQTLGLDSEGEELLEASFDGDKIALVLGAEGKGLRQKTRSVVSALTRLDMPGAIKSLNVSNAAAIALYAARQYQQKNK